MAQTIRHYWGPKGPGLVPLNYNWSLINFDSVVLVTVSEYKLQDPPSDSFRFLGSATISVANISPHGPPYDPNGNHGVSFVVDVDWNTALPIATDITVFNNGAPPEEIDYPTN